MTNPGRLKKTAAWSSVAVLGVVLLLKTLFIGYYRIPQNGLYPGLPAGATAYEIALDKSPKQQPFDASVTVPHDHFFVMGDNRLDARDSRFLGPIPFSCIIGRKF